MAAMAVQEIWAGNAHYTIDSRWSGPQSIRLAGDPTTIGWALREVLIAATLCNHATAGRNGAGWQLSGSADDQGLLAAAISGGLDPEAVRAAAPRIEEFSDRDDTQASLHRTADGADVYLRGQPEQILPRCNAMLDTHGRQWALDPADVQERAAAMRTHRLSVVAFARGKLGQVRPLTVADCRQGLILIGLVGLLVAPLTLR